MTSAHLCSAISAPEARARGCILEKAYVRGIAQIPGLSPAITVPRDSARARTREARAGRRPRIRPGRPEESLIMCADGGSSRDAGERACVRARVNKDGSGLSGGMNAAGPKSLARFFYWIAGIYEFVFIAFWKF